MVHGHSVFRENKNLSDVAMQMHQTVKHVKIPIGENLLFAYLYNAYCKHTKKETETFEILKQRAKDSGMNEYDIFQNACKELYSWYSDRYHGIFHMRFGGKGISRFMSQKTVFDRETSIASVSEKKKVELMKSGDAVLAPSYRAASSSGYFQQGGRVYKKLYGVYEFDTLYQEKQFEKYLLPNKSDVMLTTDAYDFILHSAVAFLLSPEDLDHLLQTYGFQHLHVKNIHHLAIYVTLSEAQTVEMNNEYHSFQSVRELYDCARELLNYEREPMLCEPSEDERQAFSTDSTWVLRKFLMKNKNLHRDNFLSFVANHAEIFNMRHRRLLWEHKKLVDLFAVLYDNQTDFHPEAVLEEKRWGISESQYCLYMFVCRFCKTFKHKDWNRQLYGEVKSGLSHPTREIMLLMWMYAYCFLFHPNVVTHHKLNKKVSFSRIDGKENAQYPFRDFVKKEELSVLAYLASEHGPLSGFSDGDVVVREFSGDELIAFLNEKLRDYAWGADALSEKRKFDAYILRLKGLRIRFDDDFAHVKEIRFQKTNILFDKERFVDNVPIPLVIITELFDRIKNESGDYPLECNLYEQL